MNFSESQTSKKENYNSYQKSVWRKTLTQSAFFFSKLLPGILQKKKSGIDLLEGILFWKRPWQVLSDTSSCFEWKSRYQPQNIHQNIYVGLQLYYKETAVQLFSREFCEIFQNVLQNILWTVLSLCLFLYSSMKISLKLNSATDTFLKYCLLLRKLCE